jgi:PKD repeat protein
VVNDGNYSITAVYHFTTEPTPTNPPAPPIPPKEPNQPPIAKITGPDNAYTNETLVFYAINSYDPDGNITGYQWDFENDGVFDTGWMEDTLVTHSYSSPGNYTVILQVKDDGGAIATASHTLNVIQLEPSLQLPIPRINGPYYGYTNENITFNSTGTYDPDGTITNYTWDFGDNFISYAENPIHSYSKQGNYTVILIVTDNDNLKDLTTTKAIIRDREIKEPEKERELPLTFLLILIIAIIVAIIVAILVLPRGYRITVLVEKDTSNKNEEENIESKVDEILSESDKGK